MNKYKFWDAILQLFYQEAEKSNDFVDWEEGHVVSTMVADELGDAIRFWAYKMSKYQLLQPFIISSI